jgi:hypothetical protein
MELWLKELRAQVGPVAAGKALKLSFSIAESAQRNHDTVFLLIERFAGEANAAWLPLLRAWAEVETKRVRARLREVIGRI